MLFATLGLLDVEQYMSSIFKRIFLALGASSLLVCLGWAWPVSHAISQMSFILSRYSVRCV